MKRPVIWPVFPPEFRDTSSAKYGQFRKNHFVGFHRLPVRWGIYLAVMVSVVRPSSPCAVRVPASSATLVAAFTARLDAIHHLIDRNEAILDGRKIQLEQCLRSICFDDRIRRVACTAAWVRRHLAAGTSAVPETRSGICQQALTFADTY
jgi:hypothetical protein